MTTSYGILSTYAPTQCGLATFSGALLAALTSPSDAVGVVAVVDTPEPSPVGAVDHQWVRGEPDGAALAAARLNTYDVTIVQHEYGIFSGTDGADVLDVLRAVTVPVISVLHTVQTKPTPHQREILEELVALSDAVVTMTETASDRLRAGYAVDPAKVSVIPHGALDRRPSTVPKPGPAPEEHEDGRRPVILTWGLLGTGKGIEWAIAAMAELRDADPLPVYHVVGETHPKVVEREGERYRHGLEAQVTELGVEDLVVFDARYLSTADLLRLVHTADVVLLPYDSQEQVTSGVLVEAVTARRPVVSTAFPHAQELLSSGAGLLVDRQNPAALAAALRRVLTEPGLAAAMTAEASRIAPRLLWPAVADEYRRLTRQLRQAQPARASA